MIRKVEKYIRKEGLAADGTRLVVGLSGGADSVVLLHILKSLGYFCITAHCNFHLRGEESMRDEAFVSSLVKSFQTPFYKIDFDTKKEAVERKISIEMAARDLRYNWFEKLRKELGADAIAVAHHQDDSVETLLLNLIRGTGIKGLTGIKPKSGKLIRPLLCLSKKEILAYADKNNILFVTDSTNQSSDYQRNKVRNELLPLLRTMNPSIEDAIRRTTDNLYEVFLICEDAIKYWKKQVQEGNRIHIGKLKSSPSMEQILYAILTDYGFVPDVIKNVLECLDRTPGKVFYSQEYRLLKDREFLFIDLIKSPESKEYIIEKGNFNMEKPFRMNLSEESNSEEFILENDQQIAYFDADKLRYPLLLRKWKRGDRFVPFGMSGFKKLSDYFSDRKFNLADKEKAWILTSANDIVWIVGERTDNRFRINIQTKKICVLKLF